MERAYKPESHPKRHPAVQVYDWRENVSWDPDTCGCKLEQCMELVRLVKWVHLPIGTELESRRWVRYVMHEGQLKLAVPQFQTICFLHDDSIVSSEIHEPGAEVRQPGAIMKAHIVDACEGHKDVTAYLRSTSIRSGYCSCRWVRTYAPELVNGFGNQLIHGTCMKKVCPGHQVEVDEGKYEVSDIPHVIATTVYPEPMRTPTLEERIEKLEKRFED